MKQNGPRERAGMIGDGPDWSSQMKATFSTS